MNHQSYQFARALLDWPIFSLEDWDSPTIEDWDSPTIMEQNDRSCCVEAQLKENQQPLPEPEQEPETKEPVIDQELTEEQLELLKEEVEELTTFTCI